MNSAAATTKKKKRRVASSAASRSSNREPIFIDPDPEHGNSERNGEPGSQADRISNLPEAILGEIISRLPTKDGIRTQVLASQWSPLWRAAPLNLDCREIPIISVFRRNDSNLPKAIMSGHDGPVNCLRIPACYLKCRARLVDSWLQSEKLDNIQVLDFYHDRTIHTCPSFTPSPPLSILRLSSLHTACFAMCKLPDNLVERLELPLVKRLSLVKVQMSEVSLVSLIHSICPALECLMLVQDMEFEFPCVRINSCNLTTIGIHSDKGELIIENAPSLENLFHYPYASIMQITIISAPKLKTLGRFCDCEEHKIVFGSTVIQRLSIDNLSSVVHSVKTLFIMMRWFKLDEAICMLKFFPCLENLFVQGYYCNEPTATNTWRQKHKVFLKGHDICLKTLTMENYEVTKNNTEFVKFFVLNAKMLQSIRLKFHPSRSGKVCMPEFYRKQEIKFEMDKRASNCATVTIGRTCKHLDFDLENMHLDDLSFLREPFDCRC